MKNEGALRMRLGGMTESIGPMWRQNQTQTLGTGPNCLPPVGPATQVKERVGRTTLFSSSAMSSGRLFLDGLLASIARLRFTSIIRLKLLPLRMEIIIIERQTVS